MRIIRHGVKPEEVKLYFICCHCKCEFIAEQCECTFEDDGRNGGGFVLDCPDCGKSVVGTDKEKYITKRMKGMKNDETETVSVLRARSSNLILQ